MVHRAGASVGTGAVSRGMDEDAFHKARAASDRWACRWVLAFDTSERNVQGLWSSRDELERLLRQHWSAIEFASPPKVLQVMKKSASSQQLAEMFNDALLCGVLIVYADTRVIMLLDHSVVSGHLGCRLTTWISQKEWADHIGMPAPSLLMVKPGPPTQRRPPVHPSTLPRVHAPTLRTRPT